MMKTKLLHLTLLASACLPAAVAQDKPHYVTHLCVKAQPGQLAAIADMLPDMVKIQQVRIDQGNIEFFSALRATIPAGSSARCDYLLVSGYEGYPPESSTRAQSEANFRKSGVAGTYDEYIARRDRVMSLVSTELIRGVPDGNIGGGKVAVGSYVRLNLNKTKPGHTIAEWSKHEVAGWGAYVAAVAKEDPGFGWRAEYVVAPTGSGTHWNAITVDILPNWAATGGGWGGAEVWKKVHPDMTSNAYRAKLAEMVDRRQVELYRIAALAWKK